MPTLKEKYEKQIGELVIYRDFAEWREDCGRGRWWYTVPASTDGGMVVYAVEKAGGWYHYLTWMYGDVKGLVGLLRPWDSSNNLKIPCKELLQYFAFVQRRGAQVRGGH